MECLDTWVSAQKKMILVGSNAPNAIEQKWLDELDKDDSVIVLTETTSNINHPNFFSSIDQIIAPLTEKEQKEQEQNSLQTPSLPRSGQRLVWLDPVGHGLELRYVDSGRAGDGDPTRRFGRQPVERQSRWHYIAALSRPLSQGVGAGHALIFANFSSHVR